MSHHVQEFAEPPSGRLFHTFEERLTAAGLLTGPGDESPVAEDDLDGLSPLAARYLRFMGVVGHPRVWSFRIRFAGRFRRRPDERWMPAEAWQYNSRLGTGDGVARVYTMRLRMGGVIPMTGHDTYLHGEGHMIGKLLGLVTVADGSGPEFDVGELSTYLNDALLLQPTMLLGADVTWQDLDDHTFEVALTDAGRTVRAQVTVDDRGAPRTCSTTDRYADLPGGRTQARWETPVGRWEIVGGRPFPRAANATWHLPDGPFTYVEGDFDASSLVENLPPGPHPHPYG